jgi:hypothetical protein
MPVYPFHPTQPAAASVDPDWDDAEPIPYFDALDDSDAARLRYSRAINSLLEE